MTQNQINWAKVQEEKRHNMATEGYSAIELAETARHNKQSEYTASYSAQEQARHNVAGEELDWYASGNTAMLQKSQAYRNYVEADLASLRQALDEEKFKQQKLMDAFTVTNENQKRDTERFTAEKQADRINAEIEAWLREYNFDVYKYKNSQEGRENAETFESYTKGALNIAQVIEKVFSNVQKYVSRASDRLVTSIIPGLNQILDATQSYSWNSSY